MRIIFPTTSDLSSSTNPSAQGMSRGPSNQVTRPFAVQNGPREPRGLERVIRSSKRGRDDGEDDHDLSHSKRMKSEKEQAIHRALNRDLTGSRRTSSPTSCPKKSPPAPRTPPPSSTRRYLDSTPNNVMTTAMRIYESDPFPIYQLSGTQASGDIHIGPSRILSHSYEHLPIPYGQELTDIPALVTAIHRLIDQATTLRFTELTDKLAARWIPVFDFIFAILDVLPRRPIDVVEAKEMVALIAAEHAHARFPPVDTQSEIVFGMRGPPLSTKEMSTGLFQLIDEALSLREVYTSTFFQYHLELFNFLFRALESLPRKPEELQCARASILRVASCRGTIPEDWNMDIGHYRNFIQKPDLPRLEIFEQVHDDQLRTQLVGRSLSDGTPIQIAQTFAPEDLPFPKLDSDSRSPNLFDVSIQSVGDPERPRRPVFNTAQAFVGFVPRDKAIKPRFWKVNQGACTEVDLAPPEITSMMDSTVTDEPLEPSLPPAAVAASGLTSHGTPPEVGSLPTQFSSTSSAAGDPASQELELRAAGALPKRSCLKRKNHHPKKSVLKTCLQFPRTVSRLRRVVTFSNDEPAVHEYREPEENIESDAIGTVNSPLPTKPRKKVNRRHRPRTDGAWARDFPNRWIIDKKHTLNRQIFNIHLLNWRYNVFYPYELLEQAKRKEEQRAKQQRVSIPSSQGSFGILGLVGGLAT